MTGEITINEALSSKQFLNDGKMVLKSFEVICSNFTLMSKLHCIEVKMTPATHRYE